MSQKQPDSVFVLNYHIAAVFADVSCFRSSENGRLVDLNGFLSLTVLAVSHIRQTCEMHNIATTHCTPIHALAPL